MKALIALLLISVGTRMLPHLPNFTAAFPVALFAGFYFSKRWVALSVALFPIMLTDLYLGFHESMMIVYACLAFTVFLGGWLHTQESSSGKRRLANIVGTSLVSATVFFVGSNFAVWAMTSMYLKTWAGLMDCFIAAIPFFRTLVAANLFYSAVVFGAYYSWVRWNSRLSASSHRKNLV